jgi:HSP20 family protein
MPLETASEPPFLNVSRQVNKLMDQLQKGYYNYYRPETWTPSVNLYETDTCYLVCIDLAGVEKSKIDLEVVEHNLSIRGTRHVPIPPHDDPAGAPKYRVHLMEIDHGGFNRVVELPLDVKQEEIKASYDNGMLWIELPKK